MGLVLVPIALASFPAIHALNYNELNLISNSYCTEINSIHPLWIILVVTIAYIEGGRAGNVIPESVKFGGTFKSLTNEGISCLQKKD
jgi:hypothetical protein